MASCRRCQAAVSRGARVELSHLASSMFCSSARESHSSMATPAPRPRPATHRRHAPQSPRPHCSWPAPVHTQWPSSAPHPALVLRPPPTGTTHLEEVVFHRNLFSSAAVPVCCWYTITNSDACAQSEAATAPPASTRRQCRQGKTVGRSVMITTGSSDTRGAGTAVLGGAVGGAEVALSPVSPSVSCWLVASSRGAAPCLASRSTKLLAAASTSTSRHTRTLTRDIASTHF